MAKKKVVLYLASILIRADLIDSKRDKCSD